MCKVLYAARSQRPPHRMGTCRSHPNRKCAIVARKEHTVGVETDTRALPPKAVWIQFFFGRLPRQCVGGSGVISHRNVRSCVVNDPAYKVYYNKDSKRSMDSSSKNCPWIFIRRRFTVSEDGPFLFFVEEDEDDNDGEGRDGAATTMMGNARTGHHTQEE